MSDFIVIVLAFVQCIHKYADGYQSGSSMVRLSGTTQKFGDIAENGYELLPCPSYGRLIVMKALELCLDVTEEAALRPKQLPQYGLEKSFQ
jgi:hypothetical protein